MNEVKLIDMLSYLEPELLEDDYIEKDMNKLKNLISKISESSSLITFNKGLRSIIKIITFIIASLLVLVGIIVIIIKKKKPKITKKAFNFVTN
ncbi:MAG: hypothetical protein GX237_03910 [Clostridiales bacterium]|nr:hypothetical protein [Clostridiales bacterium]